MKRAIVVAMVVVIAGLLLGPVYAQQALDPNTLKISPNSYKNAYVKIQDNFMQMRAGVPVALTKADYTLDKYITFGSAKAGMRCFMRRDSNSEQEIAAFKNGDPVTIWGYVKQPKATVADNTRFKHTEKLDIYIIEVSKIVKGWE